MGTDGMLSALLREGENYPILVKACSSLIAPTLGLPILVKACSSLTAPILGLPCRRTLHLLTARRMGPIRDPGLWLIESRCFVSC